MVKLPIPLMQLLRLYSIGWRGDEIINYITAAQITKATYEPHPFRVHSKIYCGISLFQNECNPWNAFCSRTKRGLKFNYSSKHMINDGRVSSNSRRIESIKTTSMEDVSKRELEKIKNI